MDQPIFHFTNKGGRVHMLYMGLKLQCILVTIPSSLKTGDTTTLASHKYKEFSVPNQ